MFPFVDPGWYEDYWCSNRPRPKRGRFSRSFTRFAVLAGLLVGGGLAWKHFHSDTAQVAASTGSASQPVLHDGAAVRPAVLQ